MKEKGIHLIFLGPPGGGKGTQARMIMEKINAIQISTGDILRQAVKDATPLGKTAKSFMDKGELVPDDLIIDLIKEKLSSPDFPSNWIMDGFPRTEKQAQYFDKLLKDINLSLTAVIEISVPDQILIERLTGRRVCKCGETYHIIYNKPKVEGKCNKCGNEIYQRSDDSEKVVKDRLMVYYKQTVPLIDYYQKQGLLKKVDGTQDINKVFNDILSIINY